MIAFIRPLVAVTIAFCLALTGQGIVVERGVAGPEGKIVICTGNGPVMVFVDADGQPTDEPRYCPESAMALLAATFLPSAACDPPVTISRLVWKPTHRAEVHAYAVPASARGPPQAL